MEARRTSQPKLFAALLLLALALAFLGGRLVMLPERSTPQGRPPAPLRPSSSETKQDLVAVVETQLKAFKQDDYEQAFTFASSELRRMHTVQSFREMVRKGYPVIAKSQGANFGLILDNGQQAIVNVEVSAKDQGVSYQYFLTREPRGWKISGVQLQPRKGTQV